MNSSNESWWTLVLNLGGFQWWVYVKINVVDFYGSCLIQVLNPAGSLWWLLVDPHCVSWWIPVVDLISGIK